MSNNPKKSVTELIDIECDLWALQNLQDAHVIKDEASKATEDVNEATRAAAILTYIRIRTMGL
jgi:hypothetical protein